MTRFCELFVVICLFYSVIAFPTVDENVEQTVIHQYMDAQVQREAQGQLERIDLLRREEEATFKLFRDQLEARIFELYYCKQELYKNNVKIGNDMNKNIDLHIKFLHCHAENCTDFLEKMARINEVNEMITNGVETKKRLEKKIRDLKDGIKTAQETFRKATDNDMIRGILDRFKELREL